MTAKPLRRKITQQDVAHLAGVSVAAVSLVLGGKGRISPESVSRVYQAIDALGYQQKCTVAASPDIIGIIQPYHCAFSRALLAPLSQALQAAGKSVMLMYSGVTDGALLATSDQLLKQGVQGLVLCGALGNTTKVRLRAQARRVALISVVAHLGAEAIPAIRPDNAQAAQQAAENLLGDNHQAIAYLGGENNSLVRAERLGGLSVALGKVGLAFNPALSLSCAETFAAASLAANQLLKQQPRPSAVLCDNPTVLKAAHQMLNSGNHASKWRLFSRSIVLIGFGECVESQAMGLTQIITPASDLAGRTVECLLLQLNGEPLSADDPRLVVAARALPFC